MFVDATTPSPSFSSDSGSLGLTSAPAPAPAPATPPSNLIQLLLLLLQGPPGMENHHLLLLRLMRMCLRLDPRPDSHTSRTDSPPSINRSSAEKPSQHLTNLEYHPHMTQGLIRCQLGTSCLVNPDLRRHTCFRPVSESKDHRRDIALAALPPAPRPPLPLSCGCVTRLPDTVHYSFPFFDTFISDSNRLLRGELCYSCCTHIHGTFQRPLQTFKAVHRSRDALTQPCLV